MGKSQQTSIFVLKIITKSEIYNIYMVKNHTIVEFGLKIGSNVESTLLGLNPPKSKLEIIIL